MQEVRDESPLSDGLQHGHLPALALPTPTHGATQAQEEGELFGRVEVHGTLPSAPVWEQKRGAELIKLAQ